MLTNMSKFALGHCIDKCPCCQEEGLMVEEKEAPVVIPGMKIKITTPPTELTNTYDNLEIEYGKLNEGKVVKIGLQEVCALLSQTRIRVDTFKTLALKFSLIVPRPC